MVDAAASTICKRNDGGHWYLRGWWVCLGGILLCEWVAEIVVVCLVAQTRINLATLLISPTCFISQRCHFE